MEILIVIIVIAVVIAVSTPQVTGFIRNYNFSSDMRMMVTAINQAKNRSMRNCQITAVQFIPNTETTQARYVAFVDNGAGGGTAGNGILDGTEQVIQSGSLHSGITMQQPLLNNILNEGKSTLFDGMGLPWGFNGGAPVRYSGSITATMTTSSGATMAKRIVISTGGNLSIDIPPGY